MPESDPVVVIGSGPAGATAALFLSRAGFRPLVLEAGSARANLGFTARIRGVTVAKRKPPLQQRADLVATADPRAVLFESLAPGGLSNHWACAVPRFSPDDFSDAKRAGAAYAWPIAYSDLEPWYDQVEPLLHVAGSSKNVANLPAGVVRSLTSLGSDWGVVAERAADSGRSLVPMPYAYGAETTLTRSATAFNAFKRLLEPAQSAGNLRMQCDASVLRLEWSRLDDRVAAVICRTRGGAQKRIPCRAVVLAAGAVNSAQILLESKDVTWPTGIGNGHDLVGRYLHDHPLAKLVVRLRRRLPVSPATYVTRPGLDQSEPLYAAAFMQWGDVRTRAKTLLSTQPGKSARLGFSVFGTMVPTPEDRVSLLASDGTGRSQIAYALSYPDKALRVLEDARDDLLGILERAGLGPSVEVFHVEPPGTSVHYGGTCRMHAAPEFGVVDQKCRVFGARNVAIADSSVFTTGPEKNPVLTAMALAARAGHALAEDLRAGTT